MFCCTSRDPQGTLFPNVLFDACVYRAVCCRRAKAVKELLTRCAARLDDWVTRGLVGSLKLPMAWINEAKVCRSMSFVEVA